MNIRVKLMGMLKDRSPDDGSLELAADATIDDLLAALEIQSETIQAVTVNGAIERNKGRALTDNDEVVVLPPVGGG